MTLDQSLLEKHIKNANYHKLENYLAKFRGSVPEEVIALAGQKFLESDNKTISNSYSIIKLLAPYTDPVKFAAFQEQDVFVKKYAQYVEHRTNRDILKILDDKIERDYIYPIKYPEKTSFIRKLLRLPHKRKSVDVLEDFKTNLPNMISKLKDEIMKDEKLKDAAGNMIISPEKLNSLIYERISLKASKQLRLDRLVIDRVFEEKNIEQCNIINERIKTFNTQESISKEEVMMEIQKEFQSLVPPHMISQLKTAILHINNDKLDPALQASLNSDIKQILQQHIKFVEQELQDKQSKGLSKDVVNIVHNLHLAGINNILDPSNAEKYSNELEIVQSKFYESIRHKALTANSSQKIEFLEWEKEAIDLMSKSEPLNAVEKLHAAKFIEYATDNKEFNHKLGRLIKRDHSLTQFPNYASIIQNVYKHSYKTFNLTKIKESLEKLSKIIAKYESDPQTTFAPEEKISLSELGFVMKFCNPSTGDIVKKWNNMAGEEKINELAKMYADGVRILITLEGTVDRELKIKDGELIMDIAEQYHNIFHHSTSFVDKIQDYITPYSHSAIGLENISDTDSTITPGVSHIWEEYERKKIYSYRTLFSEQFAINPIKLITKDMKALLIGKLPDIDTEAKLEEKLKKDFRETSKTLHLENQLSGNTTSRDEEINKLHNSSSRRIKAGLADIIPFGHRTKKEVKSWANNVLEEHAQGKSLHKILGDETDNTLICSEFTAKMTVLALVALEKQIESEMKQKDANISLPKEGIIKLPFLRNEDLSKVSPARLVKELQRANAIEKVEKEGIARSAINYR